MKSISEFAEKNVHTLFTDIDDTLTDEGKLRDEAYSALWDLTKAGIKVVPITGRPAGWCEMIARFWPVAGVVGENGGFYFRYDTHEKKMHRHYCVSEKEMQSNRQKLNAIAVEVLKNIPGTAIASDQFCRLLDLAIDFAEDVPPLPEAQVDKIVQIFEKHGAQAKVSSIHVNGWFGSYNKLSMCQTFVRDVFKMDADRDNKRFAFAGDSPNDEPMFAYFQNSFAVANIQNFLHRLQHHPRYVTTQPGGQGFVEIAQALCRVCS